MGKMDLSGEFALQKGFLKPVALIAVMGLAAACTKRDAALDPSVVFDPMLRPIATIMNSTEPWIAHSCGLRARAM
jgi:hypothetical protein